eukprot:3592090-Rhodomonas_salina.1
MLGADIAHGARRNVAKLRKKLAENPSETIQELIRKEKLAGKEGESNSASDALVWLKRCCTSFDFQAHSPLPDFFSSSQPELDAPPPAPAPAPAPPLLLRGSSPCCGPVRRRPLPSPLLHPIKPKPILLPHTRIQPTPILSSCTRITPHPLPSLRARAGTAEKRRRGGGGGEGGVTEAV